MTRRRRNLRGRKFGTLNVSSRSRPGRKGMEWMCRCDCGNEVWVRSDHLVSGNTQGCGMCRWWDNEKQIADDHAEA